MPVREEGFYWVRRANLMGKGKWKPAEWQDGAWWFIGREEYFQDSDSYEVGPKIEPPKETQ